MIRIMHSNYASLVTQVYIELDGLAKKVQHLDHCFTTSNEYQMCFDFGPFDFDRKCKVLIRSKWIEPWMTSMVQSDRRPLLNL